MYVLFCFFSVHFVHNCYFAVIMFFRRKAYDVFESSARRTNERRAEVGIKVFVPDYKQNYVVKFVLWI